MTWWIVGGVLVLLLVAMLVVAFGNRYAKVFTDAHLQEFCERLEAIRTAACEQIHDAGTEPMPKSAEAVLADPRNAQTDAGMRLSYTVTRSAERPGMLAHHLSMSHEKKLPALSFSQFFVGLAIVRYGLTPEKVAAQRTPNLVTHVLWEVPEDENEAFAASGDDTPSVEELPELRETARAQGAQVSL